MKQLRVRGHTLRHEGHAVVDGRWVRVGPAVCRCGWQSESLGTKLERQAAHSEHKRTLLDQRSDRG